MNIKKARWPPLTYGVTTSPKINTGILLRFWRFSARDIEERKLWKEYMLAYEEMVRNTASKKAPWYVVPADKKWFARLVVSCAITDKFDSMGLAYPKLD